VPRIGVAIAGIGGLTFATIVTLHELPGFGDIRYRQPPLCRQQRTLEDQRAKPILAISPA